MTQIKYLICAFMMTLYFFMTASVEAQTATTNIPDSVSRIVITAPPQGATMPLTLNGSTDKALVSVTNTGATTGGGVGVSGNAPVGYGVQGSGLIGVNGTGGLNGTGVSGSSSGKGIGVLGQSVEGQGVQGIGRERGVYGRGGVGVYGEQSGNTGSIGVLGTASGTNIGVWGENQDPSGFAGYFKGRVVVVGDLSAKNLTAASCVGCSPPSDRNLKSNFSTVNPRFILDRLVAVPIQTWNYNFESRGVRHIGPVAQDFRAAFGLGEGDKTINTVDAQGVALAAIQGLYQMIQEKDKKIEQLENRLSQLEQRTGRRARRGARQ